MHPELFRIPFTDMTVKSYGTMMVLGFLAVMYVIRILSRRMGENAEHITTAALYSLISGVLGARLFYVVHYWHQFSGENFFKIFALWEGGLELLGGVITAICVIAIYLRMQKLPVRRYLDILAIGLLLGLSFGRIGCFFNGCCFGKPTNLPIAITFPYNSIPHQSQVKPDHERNRPKPYIDLPAEFFGYLDGTGTWIPAPAPDKYSYHLKPFDLLSESQKLQVTHGEYKPLPVHPAQFYSSFSALMASLMLYLWRRWGLKFEKQKIQPPFYLRAGSTFAMMFILYGVTRFMLEFVRDDNPFEFNGLTVSQNIGIVLVALGLLQIVIFAKIKPDRLSAENLT